MADSLIERLKVIKALAYEDFTAHTLGEAIARLSDGMVRKFCVWDGCDLEAKYCEGHAKEAFAPAEGRGYEYEDGDKLAEALGVPRTEGGHLNVRKMIAKIRDGEAAIQVLREWLQARSRFTSLDDERKAMPELEKRAQKIVSGTYVPPAEGKREEPLSALQAWADERIINATGAARSLLEDLQAELDHHAHPRTEQNAAPQEKVKAAQSSFPESVPAGAAPHSRTEAKRIAVQKGEPMPRFDAPAAEFLAECSCQNSGMCMHDYLGPICKRGLEPATHAAPAAEVCEWEQKWPNGPYQLGCCNIDSTSIIPPPKECDYCGKRVVVRDESGRGG